MVYKNHFESLLADEIIQGTMEDYSISTKLYKPPKKELKIFWGKTQMDADNFISQHSQIFGITKSGKTTTGAKLAEELIENKVKLCIIDNEKGDFRSFEQYPTAKIVELDDLPSNAEEFAKKFVYDDSSIIFSRGKNLDREEYMPFIKDFFENMLSFSIDRKKEVDKHKIECKKQGVAPTMFMKSIKIFIDEAQDFLPKELSDISDTDLKKQIKGFRKTIEKIARQALSYGISLCIMCQRPTDMITSIRSQTEIWILHRQTTENDLDHYCSVAPTGRGRKKAYFMEECKLLSRGECFFVMFGIMNKYKVRNRKTAHGSSSVSMADVLEWSA